MPTALYFVVATVRLCESEKIPSRQVFANIFFIPIIF